MDIGPVAEIRDPASNYVLRLTTMSSNIMAMRVNAPTVASFISIDLQFNYDDPCWKEGAYGEKTGMAILQPGQSVQWKIKLEIFSLTGGPSQRQ